MSLIVLTEPHCNVTLTVKGAQWWVSLMIGPNSPSSASSYPTSAPASSPAALLSISNFVWVHIYLWSHLWVLVVCGQPRERQGWTLTWGCGIFGQQENSGSLILTISSLS